MPVDSSPVSSPRSAPVPRRLDAVGRALFAPLLLGRVPGWRVLSWDVEQGLTLTVQALAEGATPILIELEDRHDARDCHARTGRFNVSARHLFDAVQPLDVNERQFVDRLLIMVRQAELRLPLLPPDAPLQPERSQVREILVERALMPEGDGAYYFNPYAGCIIGCRYCYVDERANLSRRLEGRAPAAWGRWVDVKVNAAEVMRREVRTLAPGLVRMSPILTDPYQPVEKHYRITRQCLEVMLEAGFTPGILTRGARVRDDLPLLRRFPRAAVGFSIPTDDDAIRRVFEPGADPVEERFEALAELHAAGIYTFVVIQPVLPMNVERVVARLAPYVRAVRIDRMHQPERHRHLYEQAGIPYALEEGFSERTMAALREGFSRRGVRIDELDNLTQLVAEGLR